jgi:3-methyl-2-oxobutanoate hydroxymethyltransferase
MKKTTASIQQQKKDHQPVTMLTAYDYPTALMQDQAGVDVVLVGDSVGTNVLGYESEKEVTIDDMAHHLRAVVRAVINAYIMVDMPFGSADDPFLAYENARFLIDQGADCVKVEGWKEKKSVIANLADKGISVCAHIGYNPQIHGSKAMTFGKDAAEAIELLESARVLQNAGASMIVIEKVPEEIAELITLDLKIPVIGIGSGRRCDAQVLVVNDIFGLAPKVFRHVHRYVDLKPLMVEAIKKYCDDVACRKFPFDENIWHSDPENLKKVRLAMQNEKK